MIGILGKKLGMTQIISAEGALLPATVIESGPCVVTQVKTPAKDHYQAIQLGFADKKEKHTPRPELKHFQAAKTAAKRFVREFKVKPDEKFELGQVIKTDIFKPGDTVDITGRSIGKGFQGVMKRWNFHGGPGSHGSTFHRAPGSIGSNTFPGRTFRGLKMPGRMGGDRITVQSLEILQVDVERNILVVRGSVPGAENGWLVIRKALKQRKPKRIHVSKKAKPAKEEAKKKPSAPKKK